MLGPAGVLLLARIDPELQAVLWRRQRTGREVIQRARRVEGLVEIHQRPMALRQRDVQEPSAAVRFMSDRKSTRLNSSHLVISYAVFCLKKKKIEYIRESMAYNGLRSDHALYT